MSKNQEHSIACEVGGISDFPISFAVLQLVKFQRSIVSENLRNIGLFPGQELLLMQLWEKDCQPQNALGKALEINHSTVTKSVKRLEEAGLVIRERSKVDKRITNICLTDEGIALKEQVFLIWENIEKRMSTELSNEEKQQFLALVEKII